MQSVQEQGKICLLDIDIQGAQNVKKSDLDALYIFISPPSMEELERRLRGRGTEKEDAILRRLAMLPLLSSFCRQRAFGRRAVSQNYFGRIN